MVYPVSFVPEVSDIMDTVRELTDSPVVLGGSGAGLVPEALLRKLRGDFIVVSDGERSFVELLRALETGSPTGAIPGVGAMSGDELQMTPPAPVGFPGPSPDLGRWIDVNRYTRRGGSYNIQSKRGCHQACIYCTYNQSLEGSRVRLRSPREVVDEVEAAIFKYKPAIFEFVDSVFNDPVEHSLEILEEIVRRPWTAQFTAMGVHPRNLDRSYLELMWRAGFRSFMITPESASETMLASYRKGFGLEDVIRAAEAINSTAFCAWWFFMIGGPQETNHTLQQSLDFALKRLQKQGGAATHVAHFFLGVRIYPRTKLWETALQDGFIRSDSDPLEQLWYLSRELDLDEAVSRMNAAAAQCPEIYLGFDERILAFSRIAAVFFKTFGFAGPYWRYFRTANAFGLKTGLRFMYRPRDMVGMLRSRLLRQGSGAFSPDNS